MKIFPKKMWLIFLSCVVGMQVCIFAKVPMHVMNFYMYNAVHFMLSRALVAAAELRIADQLYKQSSSLEELAQSTATHQESLKRLLNLLMLHGVFAQDKEGKYCNTELSEYLRKDHSNSIRPLVLHEDATRWNCYGHVRESIQSGKPVFNELYEKSYFEYLADNKPLHDRFYEAMNSISAYEEEVIAASYPFGAFKNILDIGGAQGGLLRNIVTMYPIVYVTLGDLPPVVINHALVKDFPDRAQAMPLNFFEPFCHDADLFIVKRVLHDWNDEEVLRILTNIKHAMPDQSSFLIIEALIDSASHDSKIISHIDLVLLTIFGGKERTLQEMKVLIESAEFMITDVYKTESLVSIIECKKK